MQSLSGISLYVFAALYVLAVFPFISYATPLNETSIQRRDLASSLVWMNTGSVPGASDYATYTELQASVDDGAILFGLQGLFNNFIVDGQQGAQSSNGYANQFPNSGFVPTIYGIAVWGSDADWFNAANLNSPGAAENLATWMKNQMSSTDQVIACGYPFYNDEPTWGVFLVTLGWNNQAYSLSNDELAAYFNACIDAY